MDFATKLEETSDFLEQYLWYIGNTEVPRVYHLWSAIALISAAVSDRVWVRKGFDQLAPNIYILLLGPSASGKGTAIKRACKFAIEWPVIRLVSGNVTKQGLILELARRRRATETPDIVPSKVFLVHPELRDNVPEGAIGYELLTYLTNIYEGIDQSYIIASRDRSDALRPRVVWLAGSTDAWVRKSIPPDFLDGGFAGRIIVVPGVGSPVRIANPQELDPERLLMEKYLRGRLGALTRLNGEFAEMPEAAKFRSAWYESEEQRRKPDDARLEARFRREDDTVRKLAMVMALSESTDLVVDAHHYERALELWRWTERGFLALCDAAYSSEEMELANRLGRTICQAGGEIVWSKAMVRSHLTAIQMESAIKTLEMQDRVIVVRQPKRRVIYWKPGRPPIRGAKIPPKPQYPSLVKRYDEAQRPEEE